MRCGFCHSGKVKSAEQYGVNRQQCDSCNTITKQAELKLTETQQKIINYLSNWKPEVVTDSRDVTQDLDQDGIARAIGISRSNIPRFMSPLLDSNLVGQKKAHILDENNRTIGKMKRWVYYLTPAGKALVTESFSAETDPEEWKQQGFNHHGDLPYKTMDKIYKDARKEREYNMQHPKDGSKIHLSRRNDWDSMGILDDYSNGSILITEVIYEDKSKKNAFYTLDFRFDLTNFTSPYKINPNDENDYLWVYDNFNFDPVNPRGYASLIISDGKEERKIISSHPFKEMNAESFSHRAETFEATRGEMRQRRRTLFYELPYEEESEDKDINKYARNNAGSVLWQATYQALRDEGRSHEQAETFCNTKFFDRFYEYLSEGLRQPIRNLFNNLRKPSLGLTRKQRRENRIANEMFEKYFPDMASETFQAEEPFICPECRRASTKSKTSQVCVRCESEYQAGRNAPDRYYSETFDRHRSRNKRKKCKRPYCTKPIFVDFNGYCSQLCESKEKPDWMAADSWAPIKPTRPSEDWPTREGPPRRPRRRDVPEPGPERRPF